jgi:hypothetical protein
MLFVVQYMDTIATLAAMHNRQQQQQAEQLQ